MQDIVHIWVEVKEHSLVEIFHEDSPWPDLMLDPRRAARDDMLIVTASTGQELMLMLVIAQ